MDVLDGFTTTVGVAVTDQDDIKVGNTVGVASAFAPLESYDSLNTQVSVKNAASGDSGDLANGRFRK